MVHKHFDGQEVRIARVVDKAGDIAVPSSVNAVNFAVLLKQA